MKRLSNERQATIVGGAGPCGPNARPAGVVRVRPGICILFAGFGGWCNSTNQTQLIMKCDRGDATGFVVLIH